MPGISVSITEGTGSPVTDTTATSTASKPSGLHQERQLAKFNGVKPNFELHPKESGWRWKRDHHKLAGELWFLLKKYHHLLAWSLCITGLTQKTGVVFKITNDFKELMDFKHF